MEFEQTIDTFGLCRGYIHHSPLYTLMLNAALAVRNIYLWLSRNRTLVGHPVGG
jgi:hypothetical protein